MSADEGRELARTIVGRVWQFGSGMPLGEVAERYLKPLLAPLLAKARERDRLAEDLEAAAGELLLPIPEPGTDMARLCIANRLLKAKLKQAQEERDGEERLKREASERAEIFRQAWYQAMKELAVANGAESSANDRVQEAEAAFEVLKSFHHASHGPDDEPLWLLDAAEVAMSAYGHLEHAEKCARDRVQELTKALKRLRIDANRLCDRNLGGTYEDDCRLSIRLADQALSPSRPEASTPDHSWFRGEPDTELLEKLQDPKVQASLRGEEPKR